MRATDEFTLCGKASLCWAGAVLSRHHNKRPGSGSWSRVQRSRLTARYAATPLIRTTPTVPEIKSFSSMSPMVSVPNRAAPNIPTLP